MRKYSHFTFLILLLLISACTSPSSQPSEDFIQTAIAQTMAAQPKASDTSVSTPTHTSTPSITPTPTKTLTPTITQTPTETNTPTITFTPSITPTPTVSPTPTLTLFPNVVACVPQNTERVLARVVNVVDGDTIDVQIAKETYRVRYIGMDTPEKGDYCGTYATNKNAELVQGKNVLLVKDVSEVDRYDRLLRYVFVGDVFINWELVNQGYANAAAFPPDISCSTEFTSTERSARENDRGCWKPTATPKPTLPPAAPPPASQPTSPPSSKNCHPSYPTVCIPPPPPDLDCKDIPYKRFTVLPPDPHRFDGDKDGVGCES